MWRDGHDHGVHDLTICRNSRIPVVRIGTLIIKTLERQVLVLGEGYGGSQLESVLEIRDEWLARQVKVAVDVVSTVGKEKRKLFGHRCTRSAAKHTPSPHLQKKMVGSSLTWTLFAVACNGGSQSTT